MRRLPIGAAVAVLALALAGAALASSQFTQTSIITLTGHRAGRSTGISSDVHSSDPGAPGGKPKAARRLVITLPAGTRFDLRAARFCTLSVAQLTSPKLTRCPRSTKIGSGSAMANAAPIPGFSAIRLRVGAYVRNTRTILLQLTTKGVTPVLIQAKVSGARLTIPIPVQKVSGVSVVLTALKLHVPAKTSGSHVLIRAGRCTGGRFLVRSHFKYVDGSTFNTTSRSRCS